MNAMRIIIAIVWLTGLLPGMVQASDADDFVAASRSQQTAMLTRWAAMPEPARLPLLKALQQENLYTDSQKKAFTRIDGEMVALGAAKSAEGTTKAVRLTNRLRVLTVTALATHQLVSDSVTERRHAARQLQRDAQPDMLGFLQQRANRETDDVTRQSLRLALANLQLASPQAETRLNAVELLGQSDDPDVQATLTPFTRAQTEPDARVRAAAAESLDRIQHRLMWGELLGQAFMGLSLGSVLLLAALGLAITYGLLGVINMAHGEMLMLGAYATWMVQQVMAQWMPQWLALYPVVALPVAFCLTAGIGMVLERTVIRHLYGRPLETLLATWGISLMLIQLVRMTFGAQNLEVANPAWLSGGVQVFANLTLPWNRIVVLGFVLLVLFFTWLILNKTRLGLNVRAVTQNRSMAACCGVPTGRVDMLAFGLGSGIAGLGGVALSQLGNVGPELGQGYIIDSFLVVVLGGVGQLAGSVAAAFGLGIFNKILEPQMGAVLGKLLCYAVVAVALDLVWGYAGMLSLGHGIFFALGGYAMGMYLMRQAAGDGLPAFMSFLSWSELPWFWWGTQHFAWALVLIVTIPGLLALVFGWFAFRSKIKGVYFSIMTQALTYAGMLLFFRNETGFGGNNGFTGFTTLLGFSVTATTTRIALFLATVVLLLLALGTGYALAKSKFGRILTAVRDAENRLTFCGYDPRGFKLLVWTLSAVLCGLAGALYVPQVGIINPGEMSPTNSIEAAIWVALGGRGTLVGPVIGAALVNGAKSFFTVAMPEYWQLFLGLIFIAVTLFLPRGVFGLFRKGEN